MFRTGVEKIVWQLKTRREPAGYVGLSVILIPPIGEGPRMREQKKPPIPPLSLSLFSSRMALNFGGVSRWPKNRVAVFPHGLDTRDAGGSSTSSTNHRAKRALLTGYLLGSPWEGGTYSPLEPNQPPSSAFFCLAPAIRFVVIACFWSHRRRGGRTPRPSFSFEILFRGEGEEKWLNRRVDLLLSRFSRSK